MTFLRRIAALVAHHYEIEPTEIFGLRKATEIAEARHMVVWLAARHAPPAVSMSRIARAMGRDPSTLSHGNGVAQALIDQGGEFASLALSLDRQIRRAGLERLARITAAIDAEIDRIPDPPGTARSLAEQNQRFHQAMRRETEAA